MCDGLSHCSDGEDEENCGKICRCIYVIIDIHITQQAKQFRKVTEVFFLMWNRLILNSRSYFNWEAAK